MGGKRQPWKKQGNSQGQGNWRGESWDAAPPWQLWRGSWSPRQKADRYDSVAVATSAAPTQPVATASGSGKSELMKEIQRYLSSARRADTRVRKLGEEKLTRGAQWEKWAKEAKEKFIRQRKQYESDLLRIDECIALATKEGQDASQMVQALVDHGLAAKKPQEMPEAEAMWDSMMEVDDLESETGFMREALIAARRASPAGPVPLPGALATPDSAARLLAQAMQYMPGFAGSMPAPGHPSAPASAGPGPILQPAHPPGPPPPGPPGLVHPSGTVQTHPPAAAANPKAHPEAAHAAEEAPGAPYLGSPDPARIDLMKAAPAAPAASPPHRSRSGTRAPVKGAPLHPVHTGTGLVGSLACKLEAKRSAIAPFGSAVAHAKAAPAFTLNGQEHAFPVEEIDVEDDDIDLEATALPSEPT